MQALADFFLQSGFDNPSTCSSARWDPNTLEALRSRPSNRRCERGELFDPRTRRADAAKRSSNMTREELRPTARAPDPETGRRRLHHRRTARSPAGRRRRRTARSQFEITDKSDRFSRLQDAEGSARLARPSPASARTIRAIWPPASKPAARAKPYEFGDTLNLDVSATLFSAMQREGVTLPLEPGIQRPACAPVRISKLLRHGADARLQPQHDSLRRGPLHAGQDAWRWRWRI